MKTIFLRVVILYSAVFCTPRWTNQCKTMSAFNNTGRQWRRRHSSSPQAATQMSVNSDFETEMRWNVRREQTSGTHILTISSFLGSLRFTQWNCCWVLVRFWKKCKGTQHFPSFCTHSACYSTSLNHLQLFPSGPRSLKSKALHCKQSDLDQVTRFSPAPISPYCC